jgi:protein O-mannosyl-transferase
MSLTSFQKNYIKKNMHKIGIGQLSADLSLPEEKIRKFLKKRLTPEKYAKLADNQTIQKTNNSFSSAGVSSFRFKSFFLENINVFIFLFLLVFVAYFNSLGNDFVSDDIAGIKNNPNLKDISYFYSTPIGIFQRIEYFFISKTFGMNPMMFRIPNILFHFASVVTLYALVNVLYSKKSVALIAATIMAVHPILIESVGWISGAPYVQFGFFLFFTVFLYIIYSDDKKKKYWPLLMFFVAVMQMERNLVLPIMLLFYELSQGTLGFKWKKLIPYFALDLIFIVLTLSKIGERVSAISAVNYQDNSGLYNPLQQIPIAISSYLKLMLWPDKLSLYQTEMSFSTAQFTLILIAFLIFLGIVLYGWKKNRPVFFWLSFFIISLLPTLTPFKIAWIVAERYVYIGSIGIFIVTAMFFGWLIEKAGEKGKNYKKYAYSIFAIIIIALTIRTIVRNIDWKNEDHLWVATARVSPSGPNIHNNMGDVYARNGNLEKAAEEFSKSIQINPNYGDAYHNLANTYKSMGKADLAIENYNKALSINPNIWQSYQNLAGIYYELGDMKKAEENMQQAVKINPNNPELQQNLSLIQSNLKK